MILFGIVAVAGGVARMQTHIYNRRLIIASFPKEELVVADHARRHVRLDRAMGLKGLLLAGAVLFLVC